MSFPRYERYKDSGVEWLGEVPEHWEVVPVSSVAEVVNGYPFDSQLFDSDEGFPLVRIRDLNQADAETRYRGRFVEKAAITAGDVLIGMDGDFNVGRWRGVGTALLNQRMCCVRGKSDLVTQLMEYTLPIPLKAINDVTYSTTVKHLSSFQVEKIWVALPTIATEFTNLLDFLANETAKFEALIIEQRRLVKLLREKRHAAISHVVTQGLDPDVPMKQSGVEWLGEIPVDWQVLSVKWIIETMEQGWSPQCESYPAEGADEWGVLKVGCVNGGEFRQFENKLLPADLEPIPELGIRAGDVLISRANTRDLVGSAAVAKNDYPRLMLCDKLYRLRLLHEQCLPEFLAYYLGSGAARGQIELGATGASASMLNIAQSTILGMPIPLPPTDVQHEIVASLDESAATTGRLISEAERAIVLLQERRSALISAAVTGKIDVRGWAEQVV